MTAGDAAALLASFAAYDEARPVDAPGAVVDAIEVAVPAEALA